MIREEPEILTDIRDFTTEIFFEIFYFLHCYIEFTLQ